VDDDDGQPEISTNAAVMNEDSPWMDGWMDEDWLSV